MKSKIFLTLLGFAILFGLYHAAEFMIMRRNSAAGFLGFQLLFLIAAFLIAKYQFAEGFQAWGLSAGKHVLKHLTLGICMGLILYGLTYFISLWYGSEKLEAIPSFSTLSVPLSLFIFGNFFSSLSEDILTRGYIFKHLDGKINKWLIGFISAMIYLLNHIYRLTDGPETYIYLFSLGILFIIPLLYTKQLWFTTGMHWAGNCLFYLTHEIFSTQSVDKTFSPNYILVFCIGLVITLNYFLLQKLNLLKPVGAK